MEEQKSKHKAFSATDEMALLRTILANERTFLSYLRTFIGAFASGAGLVVLADHDLLILSGYVLLFISPFILVSGIVRAARSTRRLDAIREEPGVPKE